MPAPAPAPTTVETVIALLENLGTELDAAGWPARLQVTPGRAPALYVRNPEPGAAALSEHIYAAPKDDGFWFWWSWGETIAQETGQAAALIRRALRAAPAAQLAATTPPVTASSRRDPMDAARDQLARAAEAQNPSWAISHHLRGWTGVRTRDQRTETAASLPGLLALLSVAEPAGRVGAP